jgi:hypothetical protein
MHFFYLDESGDTGANLNDPDQPIFVLAGLSVADKKWNNTKERLDAIISTYFNGEVPQGFELHTIELLSPNGEGPFAGHAIERRLQLVRDLLSLIEELGHQIHYFATEKQTLQAANCEYQTIYDIKTPYLTGFDYLITYINWHIKKNLGQSARGMIVMDEKEEHHQNVEDIIQNRRFGVPNNQKVKWLVEFSYPVDSTKNPMIQLSDLIALCIKRFLEIKKGYKENVPAVVRHFYAECFNTIDKRVVGRKVIARNGRNLNHFNDFIEEIQCKPKVQWRREFGVNRN